MPRQNRVTPFSTLIATPARGTLTGNRGCLHDDRGQIRRQYQGKRWIICLLEFKGRKRPIMTPGRYTELFFLDEATALAAGHRPCAECQRERFNLFRNTWAGANPKLATTRRPAATALDDNLHRERTATGSEALWLRDSIEDLPDGTFISNDEQTAYLVLGNRLLRWSPGGYQDPPLRAMRYPARVLTPGSVVRTLAAGYPAGIHPSAFQSIEPSRTAVELKAARRTARGGRTMKIRSYQAQDRESVVNLWVRCGLVVPHNNPIRDIERKLKVNPEWFLVGEVDNEVVATCMAGYEGHRGWVNYLAVEPRLQGHGLGRQIMDAAESILKDAGSPKINLQIRSSNQKVIDFYESIGYKKDDVVSMGKRLEPDRPHDSEGRG